MLRLIKLSIGLGLVFISMYTWGQSLSKQRVLVLKDELSGEYIGDYFSYLKDYKYQYTIDEISNPAMSDSFTRSTLVTSNFGNEELAQWNKLVITNQSNHEWLLDVSVYTIDSLNFYISDGKGGFRQIREGRSKPFKDKIFKSNSFLFELSIPQGDTVTVFMEVCAFIMQYPTQVYLKEDYIEAAHTRDLITGLSAGIILLVFFYNLFIYFSIRDKNYLYYAIYVFFGAIFTFEMNGLLSEIIYAGRWVQLSVHGPLIVALSNLATVIFAIQFLETKKRTPRLDKVLRYGIAPVLIFVCFLDLTGYKLLGSLLNQSMGLMLILFSTMAAIYAYKSGLQSVRYFLVAKFFTFLGIIIFVMKTFAILPYNSFTNRAIEMGLNFEMIFFSFALADKINKYKKDKEAAIRRNQKLIEEQNEILENTVTERTKELTREKEKSDLLLLNILPSDIADELKNTGEVQAKVYDQISILFSDFQNFTKISSGFEAAKLIQEINIYFKKFDEIVTRYKVEKIKTIGDAYMAASGFSGHPVEELKKMVLCAVEMQVFVNQRIKEYEHEAHNPFEMRIGLHIGSVVAGVVGERKFQYDLWGDAVNTAARMETNGEVGKVNVSKDVYELLKDDPDYTFTHRGKISVKGKGDMDMYFIALKNNK